MMELIAQDMAPIMFLSLMVFLLVGYPVAFSLAANGLLFFFIGVELAPLSSGTISLDWPLLYALPERFWGVLSNETLLAIPFFTFMGIVLERSGMAEDLLETIGQLFGPVRGGLAYAVILVGALLAATTGVVAASVIAMGLISLPIMLRYGYDRRVASGVIAASGTLAQIIPPSLVVALCLGGAVFCFASGWLAASQGDNAGILAAALAIVFTYGIALIDRGLRINLMSRLAQQVIIVLIPPLALIFLVLGTIFLGIATPTEGGAMGAVGSLVLAAVKGRLNLTVIRQALASTTRLSSFVMFILLGARVFSLTFYGVNGHIWVEHLLTSLPGGEIGFLIVVSALVFVLAFFLDFFELAFIIVPLLAPAATKLGIDLIWFGVILGVNMQTSFMHPPFGFSLFYLRSVAPKEPYQDRVTGLTMQPVKTSQIYWGAIPFVLIQIAMIAIVIGFPGIVMRYKGPAVDMTNIKIIVPTLQPLGGGLGGLGVPNFGPPPAPGN